MNGTLSINAKDVEEIIADAATIMEQEKPALTKTETSEANAQLVEHMNKVLQNSLLSAVELRIKLKHTYWIVIGLSLTMFVVGMVLITTPIWAPWLNAQIPGDGPYDTTNILATVGIGIADLIALFLFGPINRIQRLMGNFSQLTIGIESYQMQVAIRLLEADSKVRETLGLAAAHVGTVTLEVLKTIDQYYEAEIDAKETEQKS